MNATADLDILPRAVLGLVAVHATLRRDALRLVRAAGMRDTTTDELVARAHLLSRVIKVHHRGEDELLLPELRRRQPGFDATAAAVEHEHEDLDETLAWVTTFAERGPCDEVAAEAEAARLSLEDHLAHEEREVLPVWLASFTSAEHDAFAARLRRATPVRDVSVMVPWLLEAAPVEYRELALAELPTPIRLLHQVWWRRRFESRYPLAVAA